MSITYDHIGRIITNVVSDSVRWRYRPKQNKIRMTMRRCRVLSWFALSKKSFGCTPSPNDYNQFKADKIWVNSAKLIKLSYKTDLEKTSVTKFCLDYSNPFTESTLEVYHLSWRKTQYELLFCHSVPSNQSICRGTHWHKNIKDLRSLSMKYLKVLNLLWNKWMVQWWEEETSR